MELYWSASKCRLDRWGRAFKRHASGEAASPRTLAGALWSPRADDPAAIDRLVFATVVEILASEVLTRVWAAVCCAHDRRSASRDAEPIARSVFIGHLEARHRALNLIARGGGFPAERTRSLNALRRRAEWATDLLIGHLASVDGRAEFAFDSDRSRRIADDMGLARCAKTHARWRTIVGLVHTSFDAASGRDAANQDLNASIAGGILACFPAQAFDGAGIPRAAWHARYFAASDDAQALVAELFEQESDLGRHAADGGRRQIPFPRRGFER